MVGGEKISKKFEPKIASQDGARIFFAAYKVPIFSDFPSADLCRNFIGILFSREVKDWR